MKLCFALPYYDPTTILPDSFFQYAPIMRHLPQEVAALGHEVDVVMLFPTEHTFVERGVRYHFMRPNSFMRRISRHAGRWLHRKPASIEPAWHFTKTIRRLQPDLIHFHGTNLYLNHFLLLMRLGHNRPPFVLHYHGGYPSPNGLLRRLQRFNFRRASRYLFTTSTHAQPFIEDGLIHTPKRVVPFMETSTLFRPQDRTKTRQKTGMTGDPVFLWTGRLDANKDPMTALRGFEHILSARPNAHFYVHYLTEELLPDLQHYVATRPLLETHVHFRGRAAHEHMEAIVNSADFLLQASHREFSGYAVLEAMACGVIPIVTDIPSFRAMTDGGRYGVLFPPGDVEALVRGVLALRLEDIPERSQQVRAWFDQSLSFPALARQLDVVYRAVLEEHTGGVHA